ncbi:MAG TPA: MoxR family ATPase [Clostridiaceae bacterium]|nr:MoxR family ATPase [Clostridiaceae bacterium]
MDDALNTFKKIIENVEKVILGKKEAIELTLVALACGGHVLIEDVPGVGKTSLVSSVAKSIDCSFKRIQFTPDILPSDITGFSVYNPKTGNFEFKPGAVMANIVLADEINRTSPKTQASLLEVMEERQVTVDNITYKVPKPFMVLATQNPVEYLGTYPLPEAQLDRFTLKITLGYPSPADESHILTRFKTHNPLHTLEPVADGNYILELQKTIREIHVDETLNQYIVNIVSATRTHPDVILGASPRGSLSLYRTAQAWAFYNGRDYVLPDDIKKMVIPVLSHRIFLKQEAKLKRITAEDILKDILRNVKVPV